MAVQGSTTIDFGAFPGGTYASVFISSASILGTSLAEAWIFPLSTADHSADEHVVEPPRIAACAIEAGNGFSILATANPQDFGPGGGHRCYGLWNIAWVWN